MKYVSELTTEAGLLGLFKNPPVVSISLSLALTTEYAIASLGLPVAKLTSGLPGFAVSTISIYKYELIDDGILATLEKSTVKINSSVCNSDVPLAPSNAL